jgi:predicted nucleic acid-binding protein
MTGSEKVFFDTAPFIYLVENNPKYYLPVAEYMADLISEKEGLLSTSVLSIAEFLVKPAREKDQKLQNDFETFLRELNFQISEINYNIAILSSRLRSNYSFLKGIDSLQLAAALDLNCSAFLTNDKRLKSIKEIQIILIEDLI